jgi:SNF2 family DNA or RNA helicase
LPATLRRVEDVLELDLSTARGFEFQDALTKIKDVTGRRYDGVRKIWSVEATPAKAEEIINLIAPDVDDEIRKWVVESKMHAEQDLLTPLPEDADVLIPWGFERSPWQPEHVNDEEFTGLLNYQRAAVNHMANVQRAILADDMGLGKTLEAISTVEEWRLRNMTASGELPEGPKLVICPSSVMGGWERELNRWLEPGTFGIQLVDSKDRNRRHKQITAAIKDGLWTIVNWEQLRTEKDMIEVRHRNGMVSRKKVTVMKEPLFQVPHLAWLEPTLDDLDYRVVEAARKQNEAVGWLAVLADEAHKAKNPRALQSKGLHKTFGNIMLAMTGTPIMNSPDEIWSLLRWLWPEQYTSFETFFGEYVDYYENPNISGGKPIITGVKNPDSLRFELKGRLVRRTQGQVRDSLPGKRRIYYPVDMLPHQQKLYAEAEVAIWLKVMADAEEGDKDAQTLLATAEQGAPPAALYRIPNGAARLVRLRQIIETPANLGGPEESANIEDFIEKFENSRPEPWLVFAEFKPTCDVISRTLQDRLGLLPWGSDKPGPKVAVYTGETPRAERTKIEDAYQLGQIDVIVGTIGALQVGITLTRGHLQHWMSRSFVPDINEQGEARQADRLGQQNKTFIYVPEASDTVAQLKVPVILSRKEGIVRTVVAKDKIEEVML